MNDTLRNRVMITSIIAPAILYGRQEHDLPDPYDFELEFEGNKDRSSQTIIASRIPQGLLLQVDDKMILIGEPHSETSSQDNPEDEDKNEPGGTSKEDLP